MVIKNFIGKEVIKCQMDSEEEEEDGDLVLEGALHPGPLWEEGGEGCHAVAISSAELPEHP